ncbi:Rad60/SUMO-like domain containing protein [Cryptosporidium felis]|nr:Rad60/SUMO-like domain containing protein [Cryptosporidium felis]
MDEEDDSSLFGEDVSFSKERVERLLGKYKRKSKSSASSVKANQKRQFESVNEAIIKPDTGFDGKGTKSKGNGSKVTRNKTRKQKSSSLSENEQGGSGDAGYSLGQAGNTAIEKRDVSEIVTIEEKEGENRVIQMNVKVYKRRESEIVVIKKLVVALYIDDPVKKLLAYISKNLTPKPTDLEEIKIFFDGDPVGQEMLIKEIGIENEEQLEIKVPFESIWN